MHSHALMKRISECAAKREGGILLDIGGHRPTHHSAPITQPYDYSPALQAKRDFAEAVECGFQVLDDFGGDLVRRRQKVRIVERIVLEPENVEIDLVTGDEIGMRKPPEALCLDALVPPPRLVAGDEIVGRRCPRP